MYVYHLHIYINTNIYIYIYITCIYIYKERWTACFWHNSSKRAFAQPIMSCVKEWQINMADNYLRRNVHNPLQHTATHCSTLQHIATHGNTLQHTATYGNTRQHTLQCCIVSQICMAWVNESARVCVWEMIHCTCVWHETHGVHICMNILFVYTYICILWYI